MPQTQWLIYNRNLILTILKAMNQEVGSHQNMTMLIP